MERTGFLLCPHDGSLLLLGTRKLCAGLLFAFVSLFVRESARRKVGRHTVFPFFYAFRQYVRTLPGKVRANSPVQPPSSAPPHEPCRAGCRVPSCQDLLLRGKEKVYRNADSRSGGWTFAVKKLSSSAVRRKETAIKIAQRVWKDRRIRKPEIARARRGAKGRQRGQRATSASHVVFFSRQDPRLHFGPFNSLEVHGRLCIFTRIHFIDSITDEMPVFVAAELCLPQEDHSGHGPFLCSNSRCHD